MKKVVKDAKDCSLSAPKAKVKHVGFEGAQKKVEAEGYSKKASGAIVAAASRGASAKEKAKNPRLAKVKGK